MSALRFDRVTVADAPLLLEMARAFHAEDGHHLTAAGEAAVQAVAEGEPLARGWIVRRANAAIGYFVITLGFSVEYGGRDGFLDDFYLIPAARGDGFGGDVLDFALAEAAALGIRTLHLEVDPANDRAHHIYHARGFEETGRRLMRKRLADSASVRR